MCEEIFKSLLIKTGFHSDVSGKTQCIAAGGVRRERGSAWLDDQPDPSQRGGSQPQHVCQRLLAEGR